MWKKVGIVIILFFVLIQLIRPAKNIQPQKSISTHDISTVYKMPENVKVIFQGSCYDCHSNNTEYPFYSNIQPFGWWMQFHVDEGKLELNFNEFATYPPDKQRKKLDEIVDEVKKEKMPLPSYLVLHKGAKLSQDEKSATNNWIQSIKQK